jgi:hypothetical protein
MTKRTKYLHNYNRRLGVKSRRKHKEHTSLPEMVARNSQPAGTYCSGSSVAQENAHAAAAAAASLPGATAAPGLAPCAACGATTHARRTSRLCPKYIPRAAKTTAAAAPSNTIAGAPGA